MNFDMTRFDEFMRPVWEGNTVYEESVFFLGKEEKKQLLFDADEILSVKSFDLTRTYVKGKDYDLEDGKLILLEGTDIPFTTFEEFYSEDAPDFLITRVNGEWRRTLWGEASKIKAKQVSVTYRHSAPWKGFLPPDESRSFARFISKLERGENATVFYYGDSITAGANASGRDGHAPFLPTWPELFTLAIAKKYRYTVHFIATDFEGGARLPTEDVSFGDRGVLTMINTAVGGWKVTDGIQRFEVHCELFLRKYGCDLLVLAFGMNDKKNTPEEEGQLVSDLVNLFFAFSDPDIMLVATMLPNPDANERWNLNQKYFEKVFYQVAEELRARGRSAAVAPMTGMSKAILERKVFRDWTGNNINHPNDFMIRIYAATLLRTLFG